MSETLCTGCGATVTIYAGMLRDSSGSVFCSTPSGSTWVPKHHSLDLPPARPGGLCTAETLHFMCTVEKGHRGKHEAGGSEPLFTWENDSVELPPVAIKPEAATPVLPPVEICEEINSHSYARNLHKMADFLLSRKAFDLPGRTYATGHHYFFFCDKEPFVVNPLMDELTFRSYAHQRMMFPDVQPERWAAIFQNVPAMEERFLKTFIAKLMEAAEEIEVADGSGLPNSGVTQGNSGVSSASERKPSGEDSGCQVRSLDAHQAAGSASLPVPLGREVSGSVDGHAEGIASRSPRLCDAETVTFKGGAPPTGTVSAKRKPNSQSIGLNPASAAGSENQASPADQIFSYFPLAEIVEKVFKQRSFLCN